MVIIKFLDSKENDRYVINPSSVKLGRRYDDNAEQIQVVFPENEVNTKCTMIVKDSLNKGVDLIEFTNGEIKDITTTLSQFDKVLIGFVFTKDNYAKYSSYKTFYFEPSLYPNDFEPRDPEFKGSYMEIINRNFASVRKNEDNESLIEFLNIKGEVVDTITIVGGSGGGIINESDPTVPSYVKNITEQEINNWNNSLQKNTTEKGNRVYVSQTNPMGEIEQSTIEFSDNVSANTIAKREENGCLNVGIPTKGTHATSKDYVDNIAKKIPIFNATLLDDGSYSLLIISSLEE